jgi:HAD superfamily hydrolase (TIGR01490 family)
MRKAAFFDVDGTLTTGQVWRAIMDYFKAHRERRLANFAYWAYHAPLFFLFKLGVISQTAFRRPWAAHLAWYFAGLSVEETANVWDRIVSDHMSSLWRPDSLEILNKHKAAGDLIVLVSAGPAPLEESIARLVGADMAVGTDFEVRDGHYSGRIKGKVCLAENKVFLSKERLREEGIDVDFAASSAYADSSGDVALLEMVGNAVAMHPDEHLLPIARERGWKILPE